MDDDDYQDARREISLAGKAHHELDLMRDAFKRLKDAAIHEIINSSPADFEMRERYIVTAQIIDAVQGSLMAIVERGEAAKELIKNLGDYGNYDRT